MANKQASAVPVFSWMSAESSCGASLVNSLRPSVNWFRQPCQVQLRSGITQAPAVRLQPRLRRPCGRSCRCLEAMLLECMACFATFRCSHTSFSARTPTWQACHADAPELMQALALRLQLRLWRAGGRGFSHLEAALLDCAAPGTKPGRALRLARAACLRDVCALDPDRGVRLVRGLQVGACLHHVMVMVRAA